MADREVSTKVEYERLSSRELHDLAVRRARHHLDLRFFWQLMEVLPAPAQALPPPCGYRRRSGWP